MRTRLISLLTAGALVISSLVIAGTVAQADDDTTATISGTITPTNAPNLSVQVCEVDNNNLTNCQQASVDSSGAYSATVTPGSTVIVRASGDGYLTTWLGGYNVSVYTYPTYDVNDPAVTQVTIPDQGGPVKVGSIEMVKASSISGTISMPDGYRLLQREDDAYTSNYYVYAEEVNPVTGTLYSLPAMRESSGVMALDGKYTIDNLVPGSQWVISLDYENLNVSPSNDLLTTFYGGKVGHLYENPDMRTVPGINVVTAVPGGTQNVDFTMARAAIISGKVNVPTHGQDLNMDISVCQVEDGQMTPNCQGANVVNDTQDGTGYTYSVKADPGLTYAVIASTFGYYYTWLGQYTSSTIDTNATLPSDGSVTVVNTPADGGPVSVGDITLVQAAAISGTVTLPSGYLWPDMGGSYVSAYEVGLDGSLGAQVRSYFYGGPYTIDKLDPGKMYLVLVNAGDLCLAANSGDLYCTLPNSDLVTTAHGGFASTDDVFRWDLTRSDIELVTTVTGNVPDVNIMMKKAVTVTFDAQDGTPASDAVIVAQGGTTTLPPDPTKTGYVFGGWYTQMDGAGTQFTADTVVDADVTVYAQWIPVVVPPIAYTVTFVDYIGSPTPDPMTVSAGGTVVLPPDPTSTQYSFAGWYTYVNGVRTQFTADTIVNSDMTVYASWYGAPGAVIGYDVTYDPNGGAGTAETVSYSGELGQQSPVKENDFTRDGYIFSSWNTAADGSGTSYTPGEYSLTGHVTLYAQWTEAGVPTGTSSISGTITWDPDTLVLSGTAGVPSVAGTLATVEACPPDAANGGPECRGAHFIPEGDYTIDGLTPGETYVVYAYLINSPDPKCTVHGADGFGLWTWYGGGFWPDNEPPSPKIHEIVAAEAGGNVPNIDITIMKESDATVDMTYDPNDGADPVVETYQWAEDANVANNMFSRTGYDFVSWNTSPDGSGTTYLPGDQMFMMACWADPEHEGSPATLYAQWTPVPQYTVTFDAQGGTPAQDSLSVAKGNTVVLPTAPTRDGYVFGGWYTQKDGAGAQFTKDSVVNADVTVYAKWTTNTVVVTYTVTFDAQGGTPTPNPITADSGGTVVLPAPPMWAGEGNYDFLGWYTQKNGAGAKFTAGTVVNGDVTVYAYWSPVAPPMSEVAKQVVVASTTGGASRLADGKDSYSLVTTLTSGEGLPMAGLAGHLAVVVPENVTASSFVDNNDGTYTLQVESSVPRNYVVTVTLDGDAVGSPIPVNFIGASIEEQVRAPGESQSATGLGFLPGEQVTVTVHSDPIELGVKTADAQGRVLVTFDVPSDFALGHHTVDFAGAVSGTVSTGFSVAVPAAGGASGVETGGTVQSHGSLLLLAGVLVVAGLAVQRLRHPRAAKRG